jgi:hypothetical protein
MPTAKVKLYKNPSRNKSNKIKPYVPEYQLRDVEPTEMHPKDASGALILGRKAPLSKDNPRAPRPLMRQPYAETVSSPVGRGKGLLPNVGNNIEQTWSSVDGDLIDDIQLDPDHPLIDNNEFVSPAALGLPEDFDDGDIVEGLEEEDLVKHQPNFTLEDQEVEEKSFITENELQDALKEEHLSSVLQNLEEDDYLLIVGDSSICSGPLNEVQEQARGFVFGEHPLCDGNPVPIDDIVVLKRIKVKIGLFLE